MYFQYHSDLYRCGRGQFQTKGLPDKEFVLFFSHSKAERRIVETTATIDPSSFALGSLI